MSRLRLSHASTRQRVTSKACALWHQSEKVFRKTETEHYLIPSRTQKWLSTRRRRSPSPMVVWEIPCESLTRYKGSPDSKRCQGFLCICDFLHYNASTQLDSASLLCPACACLIFRRVTSKEMLKFCKVILCISELRRDPKRRLLGLLARAHEEQL